MTYQARRIAHHASMAIWGGGNEVEASFRWFADSRDDPQSFTDDYMRVFVYTIREALLQVDPNATYVDSSPSNQVKGMDPYAKRCPSPLPPDNCACTGAPVSMQVLPSCHSGDGMLSNMTHDCLSIWEVALDALLTIGDMCIASAAAIIMAVVSNHACTQQVHNCL